MSFLSPEEKQEVVVGTGEVSMNMWVILQSGCGQQSQHAAFEEVVLTCWCSSWSGCWQASVHPGYPLSAETEDWTQHG